MRGLRTSEGPGNWPWLVSKLTNLVINKTVNYAANVLIIRLRADV